MIGASLVICSLDRVLPLYRALSKQRIPKHTSFIKRQKVGYVQTVSDELADSEAQEKWVEEFGRVLKKKRYNVHRDRGAILAEKNRFSRWGPYINHIGLIIFLLAVLMRFIPGWHMDHYVTILDGETIEVPGTNYYLKNEQFTLEFYTPEELSKQFREEGRIVPKRYETKAVLYECVADCHVPGIEPQLTEVLKHDIIVNKPLEYNGLLVYQIDYDLAAQILSVNATLADKESGEVFGQVFLDFNDPEEFYTVGPYSLRLIDYYKHYGYDDDHLPTKVSARQEAPAFIFHITGPDLPDDGTMHMYFPREIDKIQFEQDLINELAGSPFTLSAQMEDVDIAMYSTFLNLRMDRAMPYIWTGAAISMLGLIIGFYWHHRRIWLKFADGELLIGAHTNKNWFGIRKELADSLASMDIHVEPKTLEKEVTRN